MLFLIFVLGSHTQRSSGITLGSEIRNHCWWCYGNHTECLGSNLGQTNLRQVPYLLCNRFYCHIYCILKVFRKIDLWKSSAQGHKDALILCNLDVIDSVVQIIIWLNQVTRFPFSFWSYLAMLRGWLCIQELFLVALGETWEVRDWTQVSHG